MKFYRAKRITDRSIWDASVRPAVFGALAALALVPLLIPALLLWGGVVLFLRIFDRDSKSA